MLTPQKEYLLPGRMFRFQKLPLGPPGSLLEMLVDLEYHSAHSLPFLQETCMEESARHFSSTGGTNMKT